MRLVYKIPYSRALDLAEAEFVCKIPLLARALGLKAAARPSARATIGYLVYKGLVRRASKGILHTKMRHDNVDDD